MRRRIFDDLLDMQAETNRFFEEVYRRLALFEVALGNWPMGRRGWSNRVEASRQQIYSDNSQKAIVSEQYQQHATYEPQSQQSLPQSQSDYSEYGDYDEYDNYYGDTQRSAQALPRSTATNQNLPVQITENRSNILARVELPGLRQGDISVSVVGDMLMIEGQVNKSIPLPQEAASSQIMASYRNGVLELKLPRQDTKHIPIEFE